MMKVPLLELKGQYALIKEEVMKVTREIFDSQMFILGQHVENLEKEIASYTGTKHAVGVSSGTDALIIALMAEGVGHGHRVITTPYTFFATAGSVARVGAIPVFVDIDPETYNMDVNKLEETLDAMPRQDRRQCRAVIPVHLYGQCVDMDGVCRVAKQYGLSVIEDAAQAIGAEHNGRRAGAMGDFGCFSFFPTKNLGAFGDGGIVTLDSEEHYRKLLALRVHGAQDRYYHSTVGGNFRLDAIQAAVVSIKLKHLDNWTEKRRINAHRYGELFRAAGLDRYIKLPVEKCSRHIYNQYVISVQDRRNELKAFLAENGVGCEIYYPLPLHLQKCFSYLGYSEGDFPVSEYAAGHTLALPVFPELSEQQQDYVVETIARFFKVS